MRYSKKVDMKWQEKWKENNVYKFDMNNKKEKLYCLEMFSYPSGAKLHLGHWFNYAPADSFARFKKMEGYNVFHPMGFDAFGLPAENYAIKTGIHPEESTKKNIKAMKHQLEEMGGSYDWNYTVETCMPDYYKWTQWIFIQLYKAGLAYKKEAPVNWCDSCKTVLANEQVINGKCERCGSEIKRRKLAQWFFKITDYAEELLQDLNKLDWPESTKKVQVNWIGKSEGSEIVFKSINNKEITVFTTRPDTLNGVTYVVLAPESKLVKEITTKEYKESVESYIEQTSKLSEIERLSTEKEKTGVFTGAYAINPINGDKVPIWIADYVLEDYGTGAVMAVPAHDERDFEFATKFNLPIKQVIKDKNSEDVRLPFIEKGILINSGKYDGLSSEEAKKQIEAFVSKRKFFANPKFKAEFTTDNIMGVYFPYMIIDINSHAKFSGEGEELVREYTRGSGDDRRVYYDANLYHVEREFDLAISGLTIESSSDRRNKKSEDKTNNVINAIMPFDTENCVKYEANYLRGYTSEKRDTNVNELEKFVQVQAQDVARFDANDTLKQYDRGVRWQEEKLSIKGSQWQAAYLPVWLYSYQQIKGNQKILHYVAVNARTKEVMGSIPIHMPKLVGMSCLVELVGFFAMLFVDFDYSFLFLLSGFLYFWF